MRSLNRSISWVAKHALPPRLRSYGEGLTGGSLFRRLNQPQFSTLEKLVRHTTALASRLRGIRFFKFAAHSKFGQPFTFPCYSSNVFPSNFASVAAAAWNNARNVEGYIGEREFHALCMLAAAAPAGGVTVEIGSFKGKSTIGLASISQAFNLGEVISIDPHNAPSETDPDLDETGTSFADFETSLTQAGLRDRVEAHRTPSRDAAVGWNRPIRFLWIDGDHTYLGAKLDFDLFMPFLIEGGIVALHDTLHEFEGPIRVFVEDMLRSDQFGPAGLLHTIGWAQYRPREGALFRKERERLARKAARLIPLVANGRQVLGLTRMRYKLQCARVPHQILTPAEFSALLMSTAR